MQQEVFLSIVSPVYRAEQTVPLLVMEITKYAKELTKNFEIILVDDGSPDASWSKIENASQLHKYVKGIKLSRNFGQHYAITAGLDRASGDWIIVLDCDLQDKPSEFSRLFSKAMEGYDIVLARREVRQDRFFKRLGSRLFYRTLGYLTGTPQDPAIANYGIYHRQAIAAICTLREPIRYFPTMVNWVGFKKTSVNVEHGAREIGTTTYNFRKLLALALDIILANSDKPIKLTIKAGFAVAGFSLIIGIYTMVKYLSGEIVVLGYTSLLISLWFLAGLILMVLGVIGLYLGKTFEGVKNRPIYIVDKTINCIDGG